MLGQTNPSPKYGEPEDPQFMHNKHLRTNAYKTMVELNLIILKELRRHSNLIYAVLSHVMAKIPTGKIMMCTCVVLHGVAPWENFGVLSGLRYGGTLATGILPNQNPRTHRKW
ncbi:hypothetical protein ILYODFUR_032655 [Ilyodon furcidens]|uniref:Uncharacterized protein n=1 Tax=Ilyodon furcidens TaxID=33524 RepID=A0ABV0UMA8_9TELE